MDRRAAKAAISLVVVGLFLAACSGSGTTTTTAETEPTTTQVVVTTVATTTTAATTTTTATTSPPTTTTTAPPKTAIQVDGDDDFVEHTNRALGLLEESAVDAYADVFEYIDRIYAIEEGTGIRPDIKAMRVGEVTAHAPGFSAENQLIWYSSAIAHDACHSRQYWNAGVFMGQEAEIECLGDQLAVLALIDSGTYFSDYVQGLIDGADDPANQYWTDPNRHW